MADEAPKSEDAAKPAKVPAVEESKDNNKQAKEELDSKSIHVKVYSPYQTYYDGEATSLSAENDTGPFDILPRHHNFMTLVNECEVVIRVKDEEDKKLRITKGVMHVRSNKVTLFLDV